MKKNLFEIKSEEVQRILSLHESRTKSQYLTEAVLSSLKLTTELTIESVGGDKENEQENELKLFPGTIFSVKDAGNLITQVVDYQIVGNWSGQKKYGGGRGQIRFNCSSKRFKITDKSMSFSLEVKTATRFNATLRGQFNSVCEYASSNPNPQSTTPAKTTPESFETQKANSLAALKKYPCLSPDNGLTFHNATNGLHYYANNEFRYRGAGVKQSLSIPKLADGNLSGTGWESFTCETDFKTTTLPDSTVTVPKKDTQQVKTQQVNRQKQFTQNTVAAINNVQKALGVPQPNGQLKNSDIDNIISKLQ